MRELLLLAIVLGTASFVQGQTPNTAADECKVTVAKSPAIRGLHLGMTIDQAVAAVPGAENDEEIRRQLSNTRFGRTGTSIALSKYLPQEKFTGVSAVQLSFLDGKLTSLVVVYQGPEWKSVNQFLEKVSEGLRLPGSAAWQPGAALANGYKRLKCDGFEAIAYVSGGSNNSIALATLGTDEIVREREEAPKEQARRAFKP